MCLWDEEDSGAPLAGCPGCGLPLCRQCAGAETGGEKSAASTHSSAECAALAEAKSTSLLLPLRILAKRRQDPALWEKVRCAAIQILLYYV